MNVHRLLFFGLLLFFGCQAEPKVVVEETLPTRIVFLADTSGFPSNWRAGLATGLPQPNRLMVSHTGAEKPAEVLKRIPWIMQTGVDQLYLATGQWSLAWLDSLQALLPANCTLKLYAID